MAKPSPQQPSDAWATKTAGLPPVESPFPNHKGAQGGTWTGLPRYHDLAAYCNTGALQGREKRPWESHSFLQVSLQRGGGVPRVCRHIPPPPIAFLMQ